jgi:CheY-like chemotaxis protein
MQKLKILIIDNDEDEQFFIRKGFESIALFEIVDIFNNGQNLTSKITALPSQPDVILSDLNMPGKNGYEILEELKENPTLAAIPVIITTNAGSRDMREECLRLGAFDLREKPANFLEYGPFAEKLYQDLNADNTHYK